MLNQCVLSGNLGADPEVRYTQAGEPIASFSIAFHSNKEKSNWIKVKCFKKLAETCQNHLHKGDRIAVSGNLDQEEWEYKGKARKQFVIHAFSIEFINVGKDKDSNAKPPF